MEGGREERKGREMEGGLGVGGVESERERERERERRKTDRQTDRQIVCVCERETDR